jgi:hypothetical protein
MRSPITEFLEEAKAAARVEPLGSATMNSQRLAALVYACEKVLNDRRGLIAQYRQLEQEKDELRARVDEIAARLKRLERTLGERESSA